MQRSTRSSKFLVLAVVVLGAVGFVLTHNAFASIQKDLHSQMAKLMEVARFAQRHYVEDVDWNEAMEGAISGMPLGVRAEFETQPFFLRWRSPVNR